LRVWGFWAGVGKGRKIVRNKVSNIIRVFWGIKILILKQPLLMIFGNALILRGDG
jgi:hypothetical protein